MDFPLRLVFRVLIEDSFDFFNQFLWLLSDVIGLQSIEYTLQYVDVHVEGADHSLPNVKEELKLLFVDTIYVECTSKHPKDFSHLGKPVDGVCLAPFDQFLGRHH